MNGLHRALKPAYINHLLSCFLLISFNTFIIAVISAVRIETSSDRGTLMVISKNIAENNLPSYALPPDCESFFRIFLFLLILQEVLFISRKLMILK